MIDYGAVVIKNGKVINEDQFFMKMEDAVGWVDIPDKRVEDCIMVNERGKSDCANCPRALYAMRTFDGEEYRHTMGDCQGRRFIDEAGKRISGNYFAYIGDQHFTMCFYKAHYKILVDKTVTMESWYPFGSKSQRFSVGGANIRIQCLNSLAVCHASIDYKGDHYHVIYGYGIDPNFKTWRRIKVEYLGKQGAAQVDKLYRRYITK